MGEDKAFLDFAGQTLLERALSVLGDVCDSVSIAGDPARFATFTPEKSAPVVADIFPGCGPLAGIHAALAQSSADLNLMLAVDMPFVSRELLAFLLAMAGAADAIVTVPRIRKGYQPLCAVYRRSFCAVAEAALHAGNYKIDALFSAVPIRVIDDAALEAAGFSEQNFFNVNTPQDRQTARARIHGKSLPT